MNIKFRLFAFSVFLSVLFLGTQAFASFISPSRVYIQDGQSTGIVTITNTGDDPLVYAFEWERRVRSPDGKDMILLQDGQTYPGYQPADPYLIYSPRKVVVGPHQTQYLRILAQRPAGMAPGEYRSHLKITLENAGIPTQGQAGSGTLGGTILVIPALSIPVMLRTGKTIIDIKITSAQLAKEGPNEVVNVNMANNSTRSVYGDAKLVCVTPDNQQAVYKLNGYKMYVESKTDSQKFLIPPEADISKCNSLTLNLMAIREPEYIEPIASVKLK